MWLHFKKLDWLLILAAFILCVVSALELWSIDAGQQSSFFVRQSIFIFLGLAVMLVVSLVDGRLFKNYPTILLILYFVLLGGLGAVLVFGEETRGMTGWLQIGALNFEPVELAKIVVILILAKYFSSRHVEVYRVRHILASAIYAALPMGLVLLQPDLGSALVLGAIWLGIVILSGIKLRHLLIVVLLAAVIASLAWAFAFKEYQKERILTFLNPAKDPLGHSYNVIQSKIAIGDGGFLGRGLGHGTQGQLNFLPEKHSDFIFALFAQEWGFLGVLFLLGAYLLFFYRLVRLALRSTNNFFRLFISGFVIMVFTQSFINIGMNLGLMPVTGISLPFVSYGGSNLLVNFIALGIIQNIATQTERGQWSERGES